MFSMLKSQPWKNKIVTKMWRLKRWWHLSKLLTITMTSLILGIFFSCPVKLWKNLKLKFRSKFNTGYLHVVWKTLYDFNPIVDEPFFRGCSWIGGPKRSPSLKYVLHILQWWHLTLLWLTERKSHKYISHVTHHLSSDGISIFHRKLANFAIPRNTDIDCIWGHNF